MGTVEELVASLEGKRVYIDTNVFLYFLDGNSDFFAPASAIIRAAERGTIDACTGDAVMAEVLVGPYRAGSLAHAERIKAFFRREGFLNILSHDADAFDLAARLRGTGGLKFIDALHFATALRNDCSTIVTNDNGIKRGEGLEVATLSAAK